MTIEGRWAGRIGAAALTLLLIICAWTVLAVTAARLGEFETLMVIAPPAEFLNSLPRDIAFADGGQHVLVLRSDRPDFAAELYAAGAALVLPARERGCLAILDR
jgi:hypothetical protein